MPDPSSGAPRAGPLDPFHFYFQRQAAQFAPDEGLLYLCYLSAYDALPTALARDAEGFWRDYYPATYPGVAWYTHMCLLAGAPHDHFQAATFRWHKGRLVNGREYLILEYPEPPDVEEEELEEDDRPILAPYFSAVLRTTTRGPAECYALGQSPKAGISTLRFCRSAAHYNLGTADQRSLPFFLELLESVQEREILGGTVRYSKHLDELDRFIWSRLKSSDGGVVSIVEAQQAGVRKDEKGKGRIEPY